MISILPEESSPFALRRQRTDRCATFLFLLGFCICFARTLIGSARRFLSHMAGTPQGLFFCQSLPVIQDVLCPLELLMKSSSESESESDFLRSLPIPSAINVVPSSSGPV